MTTMLTTLEGDESELTDELEGNLYIADNDKVYIELTPGEFTELGTTQDVLGCAMSELSGDNDFIEILDGDELTLDPEDYLYVHQNGNVYYKSPLGGYSELGSFYDIFESEDRELSGENYFEEILNGDELGKGFKFKMPKIKMPKIKFKAPKIPKFKAPKIPKFNAPKIPKFNAPKIPKINTKGVSKAISGATKGISKGISSVGKSVSNLNKNIGKGISKAVSSSAKSIGKAVSSIAKGAGDFADGLMNQQQAQEQPEEPEDELEENSDNQEEENLNESEEITDYPEDETRQIKYSESDNQEEENLNESEEITDYPEDENLNESEEIIDEMAGAHFDKNGKAYYYSPLNSEYVELSGIFDMITGIASGGGKGGSSGILSMATGALDMVAPGAGTVANMGLNAAAKQKAQIKARNAARKNQQRKLLASMLKKKVPKQPKQIQRVQPKQIQRVQPKQIQRVQPQQMNLKSSSPVLRNSRETEISKVETDKKNQTMLYVGAAGVVLLAALYSMNQKKGRK